MIEILRSTKQFDIFRKNLDKKTIGFVPTLGNLHRGHISLVKESLRNNDITIVSIFVNPKQFGPNEDYEKYPRTLGDDTNKLKELYRSEDLIGTDKQIAIFAPESIDEIYPDNFSVNISLPELSNKLCGLNRPGHFDGVSTVVYSLFSIVRPNKAYFGQKDFQQYLIIKKMIEDMRLDVQIVPMPIKREVDGLAFSSRNQYLSKEERADALILTRTLGEIKNVVKNTIWSEAKPAIDQIINESLKDTRWDYLTYLDSKNLENPVEKTYMLGLFGAFKLGDTRLIDNKLVEIKYA
ncbi:MAG: pantoate--beta-alanine ligase [Epsilonproteobacteria bacterium]|nr:MAG: pantoate--beta-alanine ligase [Campylobacterota bacterium]RLA66717.1 MAG: pantoate--beta-alanine ligase [Campylobacterota bacterium]